MSPQTEPQTPPNVQDDPGWTLKRLIVQPTDPNWNAKQAAALNQQLLAFQQIPNQQLEKVPFDFKYSFTCEDSNCKGHNMVCTDWEMGQSYRQWLNVYGANWEEKFRIRYDNDMRTKFDTHFFVGTLHEHPNNWIIIGLFYPPKPVSLPLFDV